MMEFGEDNELVHPSATVVLIRDGDAGLEALLVQRSTEVKHMGGVWVFPGGKIDEADYPEDGDDYAAAVNAAIRETQEEAGLVISADQLVYLSHWTTPKGAKKRFATWFFLAILHEDQDVQVDGGEISNHRWLCPHTAFAESEDEREQLSLMPPTYVSLIDISKYQSCHDAQRDLGERGAIIYAPRITFVDGGLCFLYEGDAGYGAENSEAQAPHHRTYMIDNKLEYIRDSFRV